MDYRSILMVFLVRDVGLAFGAVGGLIAAAGTGPAQTRHAPPRSNKHIPLGYRGTPQPCRARPAHHEKTQEEPPPRPEGRGIRPEYSVTRLVIPAVVGPEGA
jgi:hypothetical protein